MRFGAEIEAGGDEDAVHLDTDSADELEFDGGDAAHIETPGENIASAGKDGAGEESDCAGGIFRTQSDEVQLPRAPDAVVQFSRIVHTGCIG